MAGRADQGSGADPARCKTGAVLEREFRAIHGREVPPLTREQIARVRSANPASPERAGADEREARARDAETQAAYRRAVHGLGGDGQTALCLSGGGIRSAAFALGVVQALARRGLLSKTHYLSTVSGGGYTGGWLTAWAHREAERGKPFAALEREIGRRAPYAAKEAEPLSWLRSYQKFLTPSAGLGSADTWAAVCIFGRDLLLNWLVFVPLLAALLLLPHLLHTGLQVWAGSAGQPCDSSLNWVVRQALDGVLGRAPSDPEGRCGLSGLRWQGWADSLGAFLVGLGLVAAMSNRSTQGPDTMGGRGFAWCVLLPIVLGALLLLMAIAAWMPGIVEPTPGLLFLYALLCPVVFVAARALGTFWRLWRRQPRTPGTDGVSWMAEAAALVPSGALVGVLIWCGLWLRHRVGSDGFGDYRDLAAFGVPWLLLAFLGGQTLYAGLVSRTVFGQRDQEWTARASGHYLIVALTWVLCAGAVLYGMELAAHLWSVSAVAVGTGTLTLAVALSSLTKATAALKTAKERVPVSVAVAVACLIFLLCGAVLLSHATMYLIDGLPWPWETGALDAARIELAGWSYAMGPPPTWAPALLDGSRTDARHALQELCATGAALVLLGSAASLFVNVNLFSLHALYRNRLVRTFLGASNIERLTRERAMRNNFDGFSPGDDVPMGELWSGYRDGSSPPKGGKPGPFPVVNMTLNLLDTKTLAWQDRKAASFIGTPFDTGGDLVDYRESRLVASQPSVVHRFLGGRRAGAAGGISLGTAMAISGAAASPNWGYHSSPLVGFVMMLFNVRLGWWLGNPSTERKTPKWLYEGPFWGPGLFVQEALGQTSERRSYVYLSDGGHFDNLGLYEMVRRRCRTIVVSDATADADVTLEDLGRSVRQVSIDLGVRIDFERIDVRKRGDGTGVYCALGTIDYTTADGPGAPEGRILYIKPGLYDDAPADVRAYAAANAKFPHDSTLNQFFTESQFESYRALGSHVIECICGKARDGEELAMADLMQRAERYLRDAAEKAEWQQRPRRVS